MLPPPSPTTLNWSFLHKNTVVAVYRPRLGPAKSAPSSSPPSLFQEDCARTDYRATSTTRSEYCPSPSTQASAARITYIIRSPFRVLFKNLRQSIESSFCRRSSLPFSFRSIQVQLVTCCRLDPVHPSSVTSSSRARKLHYRLSIRYRHSEKCSDQFRVKWSTSTSWIKKRAVLAAAAFVDPHSLVRPYAHGDHTLRQVCETRYTSAVQAHEDVLRLIA